MNLLDMMIGGLATQPRTLAELKQEAKLRGFSIKKVDGEYRVNFKNGNEDSAYYTGDIEDAFRTMLAMEFERDGVFMLHFSNNKEEEES